MSLICNQSGMRFVIILIMLVFLTACGSSDKKIIEPSDTTAPVITLNGDSNISVYQNDSYDELGASAVDDVDGVVEVVISGTVDTTTIGSYVITYTATDNANNVSSITRTVEVIQLPDTTAPVITLNGDSNISVYQNDSYDELGASAVDDVDGVVEVVISGTVDTTTIGSYVITYTATDNANNVSSITRTVEVLSIPEPPAFSKIDVFSEPIDGAQLLRAYPRCDNCIPESYQYNWTIDGVNVSNVASYALTYSDFDKSIQIEVHASSKDNIEGSAYQIIKVQPTLIFNQVYSNGEAIAALKNDGTVVTWGDNTLGGDSSAVTYKLNNVVEIYSSGSAFAALKNDGTVVTWGYSTTGGDSSAVTDKLNNVVEIYTNGGAFAALKNDGTVVTWGYSTNGGDSSVVTDKLNNVVEVYPNGRAFAALKNDGTVVTWGEVNYGGDSAAVENQLINIVNIVPFTDGFVASKNDGSAVAWGSIPNLTKGVTKIVTLERDDDKAYAALNNDGTVVSWGDEWMSDSSAVQSRLTDVINIEPTDVGFAALKRDGTVVLWGGWYTERDFSRFYDLTNVAELYPYSIGLRNDGTVLDWTTSNSEVPNTLRNVRRVYSNGSAFAALKNNGTVITWGDSRKGADISEIQNKLTNVVKIYEINYGFVALRQNGSLIVWGKRRDNSNNYISIAEEIKPNSFGVNIVRVSHSPEIVLNGHSIENVLVNSAYVELGASAIDDRDGNIEVVISGVVDTTKLGSYTVTYTATDSDNNVTSVTRTVNVIASDHTAPEIKLKGDSTVTILLNEPYVELGAEAIDDIDGSTEVVITGVVDNTTLGHYSVTYSATDKANNSNSVTRIVNVISPASTVGVPTIALNGEPELTLMLGETYIEQGASAIDASGNNINVVISGMVDSSTPATYVITYIATDSDNNTSTATRKVIVLPIDNVAPTLTLNGASSIELFVDNIYSELGATAFDDRDGAVEVVISGEVNTSTVGTYTVTYSATDNSNNESILTRTISVISDTTAPNITLNGESEVTLYVNNIYQELGATAIDSNDGVVDVVVTGNVDTSTLGTYIVTYSATDIANNVSSVTRTVNVIADTIAPVITLNGKSEILVVINNVYTELGATAIDNNDGELEVTISGEVDTTILGNYSVTYSATDSANNTSNKTRIIKVVEPYPPIINNITIDSELSDLGYQLSAYIDCTGCLPEQHQYYWTIDGEVVSTSKDYILTPDDSHKKIQIEVIVTGSENLTSSTYKTYVPDVVQVIDIYPLYRSFAALKSDGTLITWGTCRSVVPDIGTIKRLFYADGIITVLTEEGAVITWSCLYYGEDVNRNLSDVTEVYFNGYAFAALKTDGTVVTWGHSVRGGNSSTVSEYLIDITKIFYTRYAFAALKTDGTVVTWGDSEYGGDSSSVTDSLTNVTELVSNDYAFAALKADGTVVTWGSSEYGGDSSSVIDGLTSVIKIRTLSFGFSVLKSDGSAIIWGDRYLAFGNEIDLTNVVEIYIDTPKPSSYAALKSDGSLITFGEGVTSEVYTDIAEVYPSSYILRAMKNDNSMIVVGEIPWEYGDVLRAPPLDESLLSGYDYDRSLALTGYEYDDSIVSSWLVDNYYYDSSNTINIVDVVASSDGLMHLWSDGKVDTHVSDHNAPEGGADPLDFNVASIYTNGKAYAMLKKNSTVITIDGDYFWADNWGDDSSMVAEYLSPTIDITEGANAPLLIFNGNKEITLNLNEAYIELGVSAKDDVDDTVQVVVSGTVDTSTIGKYLITYTATDSDNNVASITRTINVVQQ